MPSLRGAGGRFLSNPNAKVKIVDETAKVARLARAASITSLGAAGAYIRGIAKKSIKVSPESSAPGHQPHTRAGKLKNAIVFAVEKQQQDVVIGPNASAVGQIGSSHEFGGTEGPKPKGKSRFKLEIGGYGPIRNAGGKLVVIRLQTDAQLAQAIAVVKTLPPKLAGGGAMKNRKYPARPFMGPALNISKARLPAFWANSVKGG